MLFSFLKRLTDPTDIQAARILARTLLLWETFFSILIILRVPYTEIDWVAYMQEVDGFLQGERDYFLLKGQTGPCVYPAGFLYVFSFLKWVTLNGNILFGQIVFLLVYVLTEAVVFDLYIKSQSVPPWVLCLLCLSKRIHSIYMLRLFNDCFAMLFAYFALWLLTKTSYISSVVMFSLAVSIKMNILLMAPSVFIILIQSVSLLKLFQAVMAGALLQVLLGIPFLHYAPVSYISQAFNLGRVFLYEWTVNFRFLPESVFLSKTFALILLLLHIIILMYFCLCHWCRTEDSRSLVKTIQTFLSRKNRIRRLENKEILWITFTGNFVGTLCARSLHFQFYSWYFHSIPFLLWSTSLPCLVKVFLFFGIEICWNVFPSTILSSLSLLFFHLVLLSSLAQERPSIKRNN